MAVVSERSPRIDTTLRRHPLGTRARILLCSVFGPYARDDEYGSRALNPMELYHNQVTRVQGPFSLRMFHRSWGIMLIQANVAAPCAVFDFPTRDRFIEELRERQYDIVGITSIISNQAKVKAMCDLVREYQPRATIVVGGHIANIPDLADRIDADHIVRGEGVRWFRQYLGESTDRPLRHPLILSGIGTRSLGITCRDKPGDVAATLIPSVGCPMGCNFCSTSAMFGGKGKFVNFYETGDDLFDVMDQISRAMQVRSFFVMDENFLLYRKLHTAAVGADAAAQQGLVAGGLQFRKGAEIVHYRAACRPGNLLGLDGIGGRKQPVRKAPRSGYADSGADAPVSRHPNPRLVDHWIGRPHARQYRPGY